MRFLKGTWLRTHGCWEDHTWYKLNGVDAEISPDN